MQVKYVMRDKPAVVHPEATVQEAADTMRNLNIGFLPVWDGERLVGVITDRDITVRAVADGYHPMQLRVRDCMTPEVVYCFENQNVHEAIELMKNRDVRRLPVVDRDRRLVGVLSLDDLAIHAADKTVGQVLRDIAEAARSAH